MSRSFGDTTACLAGVHAVPEINTIELSKLDRMIILASDGVWEFLSNETVAQIAYPYFAFKNAEGAAEAIVKSALKCWRRNTPNTIDDITCVVVFLDVK